jgi:hypothetical protein
LSVPCASCSDSPVGWSNCSSRSGFRCRVAWKNGAQ